MLSNKLLDRILALIRQGYDGVSDNDLFNELALSLHTFQAARCKPIARLSQKKPCDWREIPLVPVSLFSSNVIASFDVKNAIRVFESSGTTRNNVGRHYFETLQLYEAASLQAADWALGENRFKIISLWEKRDNSSLACMIDWISEKFGKAEFECEKDSQVLLIGAAFNYVEAIEKNQVFRLPKGSIAIETGGYKGRTREIPKDELYIMISEKFSIPVSRIISEYGMCELSSPLWEKPEEMRGFKIPPWVRIRILNPENLFDVDEGNIGAIAIYDLANVGSSIGILTADLGYIKEGRLHLKGRIKSAPIKGCSTTV